MVVWNAEQYLKYAKERIQPSVDLAGSIPLEMPEHIVDIGCGPGNSTAVLAHRYPDAHILGVDNSKEMIKAARTAHPELEFSLCDASTELETLGSGFDVVFSNACIQWVQDHPVLLKHMIALLKPGGVLAIQIPYNSNEPIRRIITEVSGVWLAGDVPHILNILTPREYCDLLTSAVSCFRMWQTTYFHIMHSHKDILEWYLGAGLLPYLALIPESDRPAFEQDILSRIPSAYPKQKNGDVLFPLPRLFLLALR